MKNKVIEILDEMVESYEGNNGNWNADFILNEAKERIEKETGWIPVSERLPTEYGRYMTYAPMLEPHYIIYFDGNEWIAKFPEKITHWMPLPLPPH